jgi:ATP-dependent Lhr-like helicase
MRHGVPLVWHDRRSHHLVTFAAARDDHEWARALAGLVHDGRLRSVEIRKVNGAGVTDSPDGDWVTAIAKAAGFTDGYRGLVVRRPST